MWDTEGTNTNATPFLFGSSDGDRIAHPEITTVEMFDLVLAAEQRDPNVIHFIYGGEYDFNMMLRNLPISALTCLKNTTSVKWNGYELQHIPRKWFTIKRGKLVAKIFDVVSFFGCAYVDALDEHRIGTDAEREQIREGKKQRSGFTFDDLAYIEPYWALELKLGPILMDKLRNSFHNAGMYINSWHGPGALARFGLKQHGIKEVMAESPSEIHDAARYAFCGGRFESFAAGLYEGTVYNADINSAYPYAATFLPNLATGRWTYRTDVDRQAIRPDQFAVYHIRFDWNNRQRHTFTVGPQPLFRRYADDRVMWPNSVEGWYWSPEAYTVRDDSRAEFLDAFIYHDDGSRPFAFLANYYEHRARLKAMGDPTQIAFKLFINSIYGQTAQRAGWQKGIPKFHQLEFAGFITSMCRAMTYEVARHSWDRGELISVDTDGVFATGPFPETELVNGFGSGLGQWEAGELPGILYWQSGVYWVPDEDEPDGWKLRKARGAPKGSIPFSAAVEALEHLDDVRYIRSELIGYRWGLRNSMKDWRYFVDKPRSIAFGGSPFSKRLHNPRMCRLCRGFVDGTLHDLSPNGNGFALSNHSKMHVLPWEANDHDRPRDWEDERVTLPVDMIWTEEP